MHSLIKWYKSKYQNTLIEQSVLMLNKLIYSNKAVNQYKEYCIAIYSTYKSLTVVHFDKWLPVCHNFFMLTFSFNSFCQFCTCPIYQSFFHQTSVL